MSRSSLSLKCFLSLSTLSLMLIAGQAYADNASEKQCFDDVQGKIAWDNSKNMNWDPKNVQQLCKGTVKPSQPGQCFNTVMNGHINWGQGTDWEWQNAINLCSGSNDAEKTVQCFKNAIAAEKDWREAIMTCQREG